MSGKLLPSHRGDLFYKDKPVYRTFRTAAGTARSRLRLIFTAIGSSIIGASMGFTGVLVVRAGTAFASRFAFCGTGQLGTVGGCGSAVLWTGERYTTLTLVEPLVAHAGLNGAKTGLLWPSGQLAVTQHDGGQAEFYIVVRRSTTNEDHSAYATYQVGDWQAFTTYRKLALRMTMRNVLITISMAPQADCGLMAVPGREEPD